MVSITEKKIDKEIEIHKNCKIIGNFKDLKKHLMEKYNIIDMSSFSGLQFLNTDLIKVDGIYIEVYFKMIKIDSSE